MACKKTSNSLPNVRSYFVLFLLLSSKITIAQDYRIYHTLVNNAERCFFLNQNTDSALNYYDSAFAAFDFVFVKDCYMAAQIAYSQTDKRYIAYMRKGFAHGLQPWHMKMAPVFAPLVRDSLAMMRPFKDYALLRKKYLDGIKVGALRKMTEIAAKDQTEKRFPEDQYAAILVKNIRYVEELIRHVGFPGDKVVGISQQDILKELGYPGADIVNYVWGKGFTDHDSELSQSYFMPLLLHRRCTYLLFRPYWERLIRQGEIHPRDVAHLHDWMLLACGETINQRKKRFLLYGCSTEWENDGCYAVTGWYDQASNVCKRSVTDSLRERLFIVPLAVDSARASLGKALGFKTTFGSFYCR